MARFGGPEGRQESGDVLEGRRIGFLKWVRTTNMDLVVGTIILIVVSAVDIVGGSLKFISLHPWVVVGSEAVMVAMSVLAPFLGVLAAFGCWSCYHRRRIGFVVFAGALGTFASFYVLYLLPVLGVFGIVLIVMAKDEFLD